MKAFCTILFSVLVWTTPIYAQEIAAFERSDLGLTMSYRKDVFTPLGAVSPQVLLILKPNAGRYPTCNIIIEGGSLTIASSNLSKLTEQVLASYRSVGLTDAAPRNAAIRKVAGRDSFAVLLDYMDRGVEVRSDVTLIPHSRNTYLIFTCITERSQFDQLTPYSTTMLESISIKKVLPSMEEKAQNNLGIYALGGVLLGIAVFLGIRKLAK